VKKFLFKTVDIAPEYSKQRTTLTVFGQGAHGEIVAKPTKLDFGIILVNTLSEKDIIISNTSDCDVFYSLEIHSQISSAEREVDWQGKTPLRPNSIVGKNFLLSFPNIALSQNEKDSELETIQHSKLLPARSSQTLKMRACVKEQKDYHFTVYYRIESKDETHSNSFNTQAQKVYLCDVIAKGVHPVVQVVDVRCEGYDKSLLWQLLSMERLNKSLKEISKDPLAYADFSVDMPSTLNLSISNDTPTPSAIDPIVFDFGAALVGQKPSLISLAIKNVGQVPVDWLFCFPNDLQIEGWADPGEYTENQVHQNLILDNNIFCVTPKKGFLAPGKSAHILLAYSHEFAGYHQLPVVFKLKNGVSRSGGV
jgi:hypothetical protein